MAERPLDGHHITAGRDQAAGVEVPQIVQLDRTAPGRGACLAPLEADRVLMRRHVPAGREQVAVRPAAGAVRGNVHRQDRDQGIGEVNRALAAVLRRPNLHQPAIGALDLPGDRQSAAQEVDVADPERGGLAEPQPGERAQRHERAPLVRRLVQQCAHLGGGRQGHSDLGAAHPWQRDAVAGIGRDDPVTDGGAQDAAHIATVRRHAEHIGLYLVSTHRAEQLDKWWLSSSHNWVTTTPGKSLAEISGVLDDMDGGEWTRREAERAAEQAELRTRLNAEAAHLDAQDDDDEDDEAAEVPDLGDEILEPRPF